MLDYDGICLNEGIDPAEMAIKINIFARNEKL